MKLQRREYHRQIVTAVGILALVVGALLWIFNIISVIPGPWSAILGVIFTTISAFFGLLQWQTPSPPKAASLTSHTPSGRQTFAAYLTELPLGITQRKGALIIRVKKKYLGATLHLCRGLSPTSLATEMVSNIVEREINGVSTFFGVFHKLEPGNYTVCFHDPTKGTPVTIHAGQLSEIDWRYRDLEDERS